MTSTPQNTQVGGKSISSPSHSSSLQNAPSPNFENTRRSSSQSSTSQNTVYSSARKNQSNRKPHRNQRKPKLGGAAWGDEDEAGAMRNVNSRRGQTDITHLMEFRLPPRPQYNQSLNRGTRRNPTYGLGSGHHSIDKARYVHANYRFIVNPSGDYQRHSVDADIHLDWNNVLQVLASSDSQLSSCPICLTPPNAPRMAKCGHIFCLPCLIRYMHSTDEANPIPEKKARCKKCPICWDIIYVSDTRPLRWYSGSPYPAPKEGQDVILRLVTRQPASTLALPRDGAETLSKSEHIPWYFAAEVLEYARIMKGSQDYMTDQFSKEIRVLEIQEQEDGLMFGEETEWTQKAIKAINEAKEKAKSIANPPPLPGDQGGREKGVTLGETNSDMPPGSLVDYPSTLDESKPEISVGASAKSKEVESQELKPDKQVAISVSKAHSEEEPASSLPKTRPRGADAGPQESPFYFYQALNHYYLSPLDIRILKTAFGNFASFPSTILPRVEHVSTGHIVDDDLRKRTKYLSHLPYGCEVCFLECDWTDIVGPEILEQFTSEIERRRMRNNEKEKREERDRLRAEKLEESERWASTRRTRPSAQDENVLHADDFLPLASSLDVANSPPYGNRVGSSFATLATPSTSPEGPKTVWGTSMVNRPSPDLAAQQHPETEVDDGWLQGWEKELQEENNDLIAQVQAASLLDENGAGSSSAGGAGGASKGGGGQGKKKKGKKITLMSTTVRRAA